MSDFIVPLKQLSTSCDFGAHLDDAIRDTFVSGLISEAVQRKLLAENYVTFKHACDTALSMEINLFGLYTVHTGSSGYDGYVHVVDVNIEGQNIPMQLDTGT